MERPVIREKLSGKLITRNFGVREPFKHYCGFTDQGNDNENKSSKMILKETSHCVIRAKFLNCPDYLKRIFNENRKIRCFGIINQQKQTWLPQHRKYTNRVYTNDFTG